MANQQADAKVTALTGKAYAERNGTRITLTEGADIYASDTIITDSSSGVEIVFRDNAVIKLGPGSQVAVQDFVYDGENNPSFAVQLVTGIMTSLSGEVVKQNPAAFKISTPRATIGIRGTETYHSVQGDTEVHAVVHISKGHIVMLNSGDGQAITLGSAMQAVTLSESGKPLTIRTFQPNEMDKLQDALGGVNKQVQGQDAPPEQEEQGNAPNGGEEGAQSTAAPQAAASSTVVQDEIRVVVVAEAGTEATVTVVQAAIQAAQGTTGIIIESPVISPITGTATDPVSNTLMETLLADNPATVPTDFVPPPQSTGPTAPSETWESHNIAALNTETYTASNGNDSIIVGTMHNSVLNAGGGNDSITITTLGAGNTINGGAGSDSLYLQSTGGPNVTISGVEHVYGNNSIVTLGNGGEKVTLSGVDSVTGGSGNDNITMADPAFRGTIDAGAGNDTILLNLHSVDSMTSHVGIDGGASNDIITVNGGGDGLILNVTGGEGDDTININNFYGNTLNVEGGGGNDAINITGSGFAGNIYGGAGNDVITVDVLQGRVGGTVQIEGDGTSVVGTPSEALGNDHIIIKHIAHVPEAVASVQGGGGNDTYSLGSWENGSVLLLVGVSANGNTDKLEFMNGATEVVDSGRQTAGGWQVQFSQGADILTVIFDGVGNQAAYDALKSNNQISGLL